MKILGAGVSVVGNQRFGRVSYGFIRHRGHICQAGSKVDHNALHELGGTSWTYPVILKSCRAEESLTLAFVTYADVIVKGYYYQDFRIAESLGTRKIFLLCPCSVY